MCIRLSIIQNFCKVAELGAFTQMSHPESNSSFGIYATYKILIQGRVLIDYVTSFFLITTLSMMGTNLLVQNYILGSWMYNYMPGAAIFFKKQETKP